MPSLSRPPAPPPALLRALALPEHLSTAALLDVLGTLTTREELVEECNKIVANRE